MELSASSQARHCFSIPKGVTSERPTALLPTMIRWWEALRAHEVSRWQERHSVGWDATDGRNGGAEPTVRETLLDVDRFDYCAGGLDQGAITLVLDLAKAFERVSLPVVWVWAEHFSFPRKILRVLCGYFEHLRSEQFERCVVEPLQTNTAIFVGSKWNCCSFS